MKSKTPNKRSKVAGALAAAIGAVGLSGRADAQNAEDFVAASAIDGVSNARQLPDGSVELILEDGQIVRIPADQVSIRDGQVLISAEFAEGLAADANGFIQDNGLLIGAAAVVAAGVGIGVAVSGGGDDDEVIEVAPPVNVATAGDDSLTGTDLSDSIDGLAGDDTISGLGGDDTLDGGAGSDTLLGGEGNDTLITDGADQLDGGAGIDTADFSSLGEGVIVDLDVETAGANQTNGGVDGPSQNGAILDAPPAAGGQPVNGINVVDVENVVGTEFNDGLFGNNEVNVLDGGAGDDLVHGFAGDDFLQGGEGTDTVLFAAAPAGVTVDLNDQVDAAGFDAAVAAGEGTTAATGGAGNNVLSGFENVTGSQSDDVLTGDANDNVLIGNGGDDVLVGGAGSDTLTGGDGDDVLAGGGGTDIIDGGDGVDTNSFEGIGLGVTASLEDGTASYGQINETFVNIENLTGSSNDDSLTGDANDNVLDGGLGNDTLVGGLGDDTLIGGEGNDTADFSDIDVPVTITVDGAGNGTATRDTGFTVSVVDAVVDGSAFGAGLTPETFVSEAVDGNIYFNIHTSEFTGGEIRGQLAVDSDVTDAAGVRTITLSADLDGAQEPDNASDSEATGTASVVITVAADGTVTYSSELEVTGLAPSELISLGAVSAIHLHNAPAGVNGPVVQDFLVDAGNPSGPALPFSVAEPVSETDTLESIETFILSDDADSFISAGGGAQTVFAGEGDDFVQAGGGSDVTDGGEGVDTVSFADIGSDVTVDLSAAEDQAQYLAPSGATVIDQVTNFENVVGSANNDTITGDANDNALFGGAGSDTLTGGAGDDVLAGGGGTDIIDGGDGVDTNSFEGIGLGVTATLNADGTGTAEYGAINESFVNIENLTGSSNNDVLIATGAAANVINGGDGDDLIAGGGGTDVLDGGAGNDTNSFQGIGFDVVASLEDGTASYGPVNETFTNFENLTGSDNNDTLTGDSGVNVLDGAHGDDTLSGGAGDDTLIGGNGNDTAVFADLSSDIDVVENADGSLTVTTLTEGTDTLTGVETLLDGNGDVVFTTLSTPVSSASAQDAGLGNFVDASGIAGSEDFASNDLPDLGPLSDDAGLI